MAKQSSKKNTRNKSNSKGKNKKNTSSKKNSNKNKKQKPLKGSVLSMTVFFANVPPLVFSDVRHFHIDVKTVVVKIEKRNSSRKKEGDFTYIGYCFEGLIKIRKSL